MFPFFRRENKDVGNWERWVTFGPCPTRDTRELTGKFIRCHYVIRYKLTRQYPGEVYHVNRRLKSADYATRNSRWKFLALMTAGPLPPEWSLHDGLIRPIWQTKKEMLQLCKTDTKNVRFECFCYRDRKREGECSSGFLFLSHHYSWISKFLFWKF